MNSMISDSVGHNGKNHLIDVKRVQILLNRHYANKAVGKIQTALNVDGKCGPSLINAIREYQKTVMRIKNPDSRVTPQSPTFRMLSLNWYSKNDEACRVLDYILKEIETNVASKAVTRMQELNSFDLIKCIEDWQKEPLLTKILMSLGDGLARRSGPDGCNDELIQSSIVALILWAQKVMQGGEWDHKPYIEKNFKFSRVSKEVQRYHILGDYEYFFDIWSNIHFGYVGRAAGFTKSTLLDGAGLEQIGSKLVSLKLPKKTADGLRGWDDAHDRVSITIGIELYEKNPNNLTAYDVLEKIKDAQGRLRRRPITSINPVHYRGVRCGT